MARSKEKFLNMLRDQAGLLRASLDGFYSGNFAHALQVATIIRVLVHETWASTPLLRHIRPDGLDLQIPEHVSHERPDQEEFLRFAVSIRLGPGSTVAPAVDLRASHYRVTSIGSWWNRVVFSFASRVGRQVFYTRKQVILTLANKEGGAHVDANEDPDYARLLTDQPLSFELDGIRLETPDLARFLVAQSGVEILHCLKNSFFNDLDVPYVWECGPAPNVAIYQDEISATLMRVVPAFPRAEVQITKRQSTG